jgi:hypothetical protein
MTFDVLCTALRRGFPLLRERAAESLRAPVTGPGMARQGVRDPAILHQRPAPCPLSDLRGGPAGRQGMLSLRRLQDPPNDLLRLRIPGHEIQCSGSGREMSAPDVTFRRS